MIRVLADALTSPALLIERFGTAIPSDQTRKMLDRAIRLAAVLKRSPAERAKVVRDLIEKVVIEENAITIRMRRSSLSGGAVVPPSSKNPSDSPIELTVPVAFRRRGTEMRLVLPGVAIENDRSRCDPTLIKAIARGRAWFEELAAGRARSLRELAERDGITRRYVRRLVDLAFLSPELVEAILARPATRRTHGDAPYRTRSAARLDRSAQPPGELKSDRSRGSPGQGLGSSRCCALISRGGTAAMPVREKQPRRAGSGPARPVLWSRPGSHSRQKPGLCGGRHGRHW